MNKENCALKLVDEIILYYDVRSKKHQIMKLWFHADRMREGRKDRQTKTQTRHDDTLFVNLRRGLKIKAEFLTT